MKKKFILPLLFFFIAFAGIAQRYAFEQVNIPQVENPVYLAMSPNGLKMVLIDLPRKGLPRMVQCNRPYLDSPWGSAYEIEVINRLVNEKTRIEGLAFSFDNRYLYFSANFKNSLGGMDIYRCALSGDGDDFAEPENIGAPVNSTADENFPSVSGNNRWLFFTREVPMRKLEAFKTGEIWSAIFNDETNNWQTPEKINTEINNGGIAYPKIYDDNQTLYYSKVSPEKDRWTIHWTSKLTEIHWYLPVAFDTLMSKYNEISPFYCKQDGFLYYIVYDQSGFNPKGSIFRYRPEEKFHPKPTVKVKGKVTDATSKQALRANILVSDPTFGDVRFFTQSDQDRGDWNSLLNAGQTYMFHTWSNGYSHHYQIFEGERMHENRIHDVALFAQTTLILNVYDREELWPLDAQISVLNNRNEPFNTKIKNLAKGQFSIELPIGERYSIGVSMKDYEDNQIPFDLTNIVLFKEFIRDIDLRQQRREIEIHIRDQQTGDYLAANVELLDSRNRVLLPEVVIERPGQYRISLREGEAFEVEVRGAKGFAFKSQAFDLDTNRNLKTLEILLSPLTRKVPIALNNINFEFNSADLMENSWEELNRVVTLMNDNPDIHVEIMAHTDDLGSDRYNETLAEKRARSVVDYLIVNGIAQSRLIARGYGKRMPLVPNNSDENRAKNRRVEMKIYDKEDQEFYIEERVE